MCAMRILTDCPDEYDRLQGGAAAWQQVGSRDGAWRDLWATLSDDTSLWTTYTSRLGTDCGISHLAVINRTPASQFDALLRALNEGHSLPAGSAVIALEGRSFHGLRGRNCRQRVFQVVLATHVPAHLRSDA